MSAERTALAGFVRQATGRDVELRDFGPASSGYAIGRIHDYPSSGQTTAVTSGVARQAVSMWRGLPLGHELVLTMDSDPADVLAMVEAAVLENHGRRSRAVDRRPFVAANGVWAPGYAPHLVFTDEASATPELMVQKKLGDRYVAFLSVVPIDDRELRDYDRGPAAFIAQLAAGGRVATYPRPLP